MTEEARAAKRMAEVNILVKCVRWSVFTRECVELRYNSFVSWCSGL
jgi:hypothetical protein